MSAPTISYATTGLAADCSQVQPDINVDETPVSSADLFALLRSFGAIPAIDLINARPSIRLKIEGPFDS